MGPQPKPTPERYCAFCGKKLERKIFKSKREDLSIFNKRKYCNRECMKKAYVRNGATHQDYSSAHHTSRKIVYLIENREAKCQLCGAIRNIDIHHIDGNYGNNHSENLMVVCRSCHMKIHRQKPVCRICGKPVKGFGLCDKHYQRFKKYGDPNHVPWSTYNRKQI